MLETNNMSTVFLTVVVCPETVIDNTDVGTIKGVYKDNHTITCTSGYRIIGGGNGDVTYRTECGVNGSWTNITHCESK